MAGTVDVFDQSVRECFADEGFMIVLVAIYVGLDAYASKKVQGRVDF